MEISEEPKAKPISGLSSWARGPGGAAQEPVKAGHAQQAQAHHQHAGDGAAAKGHVQRRADAVGGGLRGAHVGAHRDVHADEAAGAREHGADHEADGRLAVEKDADQHGQHHADDGDGLVLARQVGRRARLDGGGDFLHAGVAGVFGQDPAAGPEAVGHGDQPAASASISAGWLLSCGSPRVALGRDATHRLSPLRCFLARPGGGDWPTVQFTTEAENACCAASRKPRESKIGPNPAGQRPDPFDQP
jgi:hypothetical protein